MGPALSREEWAGLEAYNIAYTDNGRLMIENEGSERDIHVGADKAHAIAALCLHGQPFGFTRHDVSLVRDAADDIDSDGPSGDEHLDRACDIQSGMLRDLADRIEALLPPED